MDSGFNARPTGSLGAVLVVVSAFAVSACSGGRDVPETSPDASTGHVDHDDTASSVIQGVTRAFAPMPTIADRFAPSSDGLISSKDGITSPGFRSAWTDRAHHVGARLPRFADDVFEAGLGVSELYRLSLLPLGAAHASAILDEGRVVYRDAFVSTDVTFAASPERLEWAYTLKDDKAPLEFAIAIKLPKNLTSAKLDPQGGLAFVDASGNALLRVPRALAIDSKGVKRDAPIAWDGKTLSVKLDRSGLALPIVIDPAVETVVWEPRMQIPTAREHSAATFDSARGRVVMFGGSLNGPDSNETWEWDGTVWSLRASSGPSARRHAAMAFDSVRKVSVLFGGGYTDETWEWNGTAWVERCTAAPCSSTRPHMRSGAALVYDPVRARTVLFGGYGFNGSAWVAASDTWLWDGSAWTSSPATGPAGRDLHRMTFDTVGNRVLMFGGQTVGPDEYTGPYLGDLWAFNGTSWSSVTTSGGPPAVRSRHAFAFQTANGRALLYGGENAVSPYRQTDTWEFVSSTNTWVSVGGANPGYRRGHAAAYDSSRQVVVIYGGGSGNLRSDTWEFKSGAWSQRSGQMLERLWSASVFDSFRNRVVLFGGRTGAGTSFNDVWEWTGFDWTRACTDTTCAPTLPSIRYGMAAAYDSTRRYMVMFGGTGGTNETWEYNGATWTQRCTSVPCSTPPTARSGASAAYDSIRKKTVMFGGNVGGNETWEWDGATLQWTRVCTVSPCSGTMPSARVYAAMTYDPDRGRIVLFGGGNSEGASTTYGDTWEYSGTAWAQVATTGPSARYSARMAYDTVRKKTVLFGGTSVFGGTPLSDTWEWNGTTWTRTATTGPAARYGHTVDYDAARRRVVVYGGSGDATGLPDTWEYSTRGGACSVGAQCATGFCVDGVCCEQVSCGTCQACDQVGTPGQCAPVISADDPDTCPAGTSSCDATGGCKKKQGQSCAAATECATGFCANGYCCNSACGGGCDVCNATPGTCTVLSKGATGVSCGAYFCDGVSGACPTSCAADADCGSGYFCASGGICQVRRAQGTSCNTGSGGDCNVAGCRECSGTLTCKDGYCCNSACTGSCQTCSATPGTCTGKSNADDLDTCTGANTCSATAACLLKAGQACTAASQCASGNCVDGVCCNTACSGGCDVCNATAGTCTVVAQGNPGASPSCGAYVCNGSTPSCPSTCGNDADCASGFYCGPAGTCVAQKTLGATCNQGAGVDCKTAGCRVCASNNCIDGYCCNSACGSSCDACNGGALGWSGATNGTCAVAPVSYPGSPSCGAYACSGSSATCATGCTSDAQCGAGSYCNSAGACVAQKAQGAACNLATDCSVSGTCRACATGNCIDGYCCNTACGGQCQACDVSGALGTCVTVTGAVHGSRPACSGTGACAATCNGVDATACKYAGSSTVCGTTSCAAGVMTNVGSCNGAGTCNQSTTSCGNYACGTTTCKTTCATDGDCASGAFCSSNACVPKKINGDVCSGSNACTSGNCVSGICCDSACTGTGMSCNITGSLGKCSKVNGTTCTSAAECGSGRCVDGVCCDSACTGQCQACNVTGAVGTCTNVIGAPASGRAACGGTGAGTLCGARCDGSSATSCAYPTSTTSCSAASCVSGTETTAGTCNGSGVCSFTTKPCGAYTCSTTACKSTCAGDTDCAGGFYCKLGLCAPKEIEGATCAGASSCLSGNCVDGVCCSTASCGTGLRCNVPGALGRCAKPNGSACTVSTECASSFCVDGVCCDTGCSSQCAACDVTGKVGTCSAVTGAPHGSRSACSGAGSGTECGSVCDGTDMSACHYPGGSKSCGANSCTLSTGTYIEKHTSVCDGAGACSDEPKTCVGYTCGMTSCKTSCSANTDCATGYYCKTGACVPIEGLGTSCTTALTCTSGFCTDGVCCAVGSCGSGRSCSAGTGSLKGVCVSLNGTACSADAECASGVCADGVCCDTACNGSCEACNKSGSVGKCVPIVGNPLTGHPACTGTSTDSDCAARCDGTDGKSCKYPGTTASCGTPSCGGGIEKQVSTCDGAGTCKPSSKTCSPYVCGPTACLASCTKNDECGTGNYCKTGSCVKVEVLGKACTASAECGSGFCADGVCCSVASCGEGSSCAGFDTTTPGSCLKKKGVACAKADDCATGRCVDGFCCDLACNGQCEACDVAGSEGTCTPIVGAPHGMSRTACDTLEAKDCAKAQCDGKARDKCDGFVNGGTTSCGVASCTTDKRYQNVGACDGAGKCALPEPKPCTPYACDATAPTGCKSACATDDDCAADFKCEAGACIQGAKCSDDRTKSIDKTGAEKSCSPYRCGSDGKCATSCATSEDCATGTVCDTNVKACVVYTVDDSGGDGGCGCTTPGSNERPNALWLAALLGVAATVRRRRSASA